MLIKRFSLLAILLALIAIVPNKSQAQPVPEKNDVHKVVAYYFHGNFRCATCKKFEAYTREALEAAFSENLKDGSLELKVINTDESENEHYINDFQLTTRSVVLTNLVNGKQQNWKNLNAIWDHVGDKQVFIAYIQKEVGLYLSEIK